MERQRPPIDKTEVFYTKNITNKDIYEEVKSMHDTLTRVARGLEEHKKDDDTRFKWQEKLILGSYGFGMVVLGFIVSHLLAPKGG